MSLEYLFGRVWSFLLFGLVQVRGRGVSFAPSTLIADFCEVVLTLVPFVGFSFSFLAYQVSSFTV